MAYGYWKAGKANQEAVFHLYFRKQPFAGGFSVCSGLEDVIEFLTNFQFQSAELEYLGSLNGTDGRPLFVPEFLTYLAALRFRCDVDAITEGTVVFPHEPLVRVQGPLLQAQLVETALLNILNFQTLVATKAARICLAAEGDPVIEFGLRRAQGVDGGLTASRAAFVGGCAATSNVLAGRRFGIPVRGTHAHSWVMSFDSESEAFQKYLEAMPNNAVLLVDTYNSLSGVRHAIEVSKRLRETTGACLPGIRLDSGDLAYLSIEARKMLDQAGFADTHILASNDLDEHLIASLKQQKAAINAWGVGTRLVTAYDQPALGGVYKLSALRNAQGTWDYKLKLSEQSAKAGTPGILQVCRFEHQGLFVGDAIYEASKPLPRPVTIVDPSDATRRKEFSKEVAGPDLLVPVLRNGQCVYPLPSLNAIRGRAGQQLAKLHPTIKRFLNPHRYPAGLEHRLFDLKTSLIVQMRENANASGPAAATTG